jgi:hypothetical protein
MRMEEIAALAGQYGDWDDFGRWTFQNDDKLLAFVLAVQEAEREACAKYIEGLQTNSKDVECVLPLISYELRARNT